MHIKDKIIPLTKLLKRISLQIVSERENVSLSTDISMWVIPRCTQNSKRNTSSLELQCLWDCVGVFIHPHYVLDTRRLPNCVPPEPAVNRLSVKVLMVMQAIPSQPSKENMRNSVDDTRNCWTATSNRVRRWQKVQMVPRRMVELHG